MLTLAELEFKRKLTQPFRHLAIAMQVDTTLIANRLHIHKIYDTKTVVGFSKSFKTLTLWAKKYCKHVVRRLHATKSYRVNRPFDFSELANQPAKTEL